MRIRFAFSALLVLATLCGTVPFHSAIGAEGLPDDLEQQFTSSIHPFFQNHCVECHGTDEPQADLNLSAYSSMSAVVANSQHLSSLVERLEAGDMPPPDAASQPTSAERSRVISWLKALRDRETQSNAGDPGIVLARRLSNAEYNYTIRDLTGVDIQPTRQFPVDPANTAGFDNSGESLVMSPALLNKFLQAAREVASHLYLKPEGFSFASHPMLAETDRDKHCVQQIIDFYHRQNTNYADYFHAAWRFKHVAATEKPLASLADIAADRNLSSKYLAMVWSTLEESRDEVGPLVKLQAMWHALPATNSDQPDPAREGCEKMRDYVVELRKKVEPRFLNITSGKLNASSQPFLIWKNIQYATHRMTFDPAQLQVEGEPGPKPPAVEEPGAENEFGPGYTQLVKNTPGDPDLFVPKGERARYEAAFAKFCRIFPDKFYMEERGRNYFDTSQDRGRYLNAGFHSLMGYFRDDMPLYTLLLDEKQQQQLDAMWFELDFVASATERMFIEYYSSGNRQIRSSDENDQTGVKAPAEGVITSETSIKDREEILVIRASQPDDRSDDWEEKSEDRKAMSDEVEMPPPINPVAIQAIKDYFKFINDTVRRVEKARIDAEPSHLAALLQFAMKAYRRPLSPAEQEDLLSFYRSAREQDGLDHETAIRDSVVAVLMSPDFCYRIDLIGTESAVHPLSDYDLASRLSYFLWSSAPDEELLAHAAAGDLHEPSVIVAEVRRMLKDPRMRALAVEFGGNWLDFRRFEEISTVDRERFETFSDDLKVAMFEEPVRLMLDVFQNNRPILDFLYADDTFVNSTLASHYEIPSSSKNPDDWVRVEGAGQYHRGGLLPMAVFLTKNAPGLRTSPVKRGNWVVKNVLGERIPPPPPVVPELPQDEAKLDLPLREMLARHRADPSCAACHARFDSFGLAFEGFGPIGERREKDLAGRDVDVSAKFPDGTEGADLKGLQDYIRNQREVDFVDNLCGKMLAFALGRSLMLSDDILIHQMRENLIASDYRFATIIESIVTSRQFLNKRGQ